MTTETVLTNEQEVITLAVVTTTERKEIRIPYEVVNRGMDSVISVLREKGLPLPSNPVLTRAEDNTYMLHEAPAFG